MSRRFEVRTAAGMLQAELGGDRAISAGFLLEYSRVTTV